MKTVAIMQPYFFPYTGYWQLIRAADLFVIYDDVNYIKGGWINRNRLLINGHPTFITAPLQHASPHKRICDTALLPAPAWRDKLVKMIDNTYRRSPFFSEVFPIIEQLIRHDDDNLATYLAHQLQTLSAFMGIDTEWVISSRRYGNESLSGQARVLDICRIEGATSYINLPGGRSLYDPKVFHEAGIDLRFIAMHIMSYPQPVAEFTPHLSIIDALMGVGPQAIRNHLDAFELMTNEI